MADAGRILGGRYQLLELVGQGGMATIYRARDDQLGRDVAVKVLRAEYGSDAAFVLRFRREAQAAAQLSHPNVVSIYDTGSDEIGPYIVMELVTGGDLAGVLRERGPLPASAAARIAQQIADALEAAHARGIVHRDIKPSNVLLTSGGRVKVADFGIAQAFTEVQLTLTQPGMTMGSVHYFSPEQARGEVVTGASDVYSAGLVLFEMLTGMRPFGGDSAAAVAMARLTGQVPSPAMVRPDVPGGPGRHRALGARPRSARPTHRDRAVDGAGPGPGRSARRVRLPGRGPAAACHARAAVRPGAAVDALDPRRPGRLVRGVERPVPAGPGRCADLPHHRLGEHRQRPGRGAVGDPHARRDALAAAGRDAVAGAAVRGDAARGRSPPRRPLRSDSST